jgi:V/A-type H+-transporting ATPase subunit E
MAEPKKTSSGVQELISQIRDEGVKAAQTEADRLLKEAKEQAAVIHEKAKTMAEETKSKARQEIEDERTATLEALNLAARDTIVRLGEEVRTVFESHVKRLISQELQDEKILREVILTVAGKACKRLEKNEAVEILLSPESFDHESIDTHKGSKGEERLKHFILKITGDMLREGIEIKPSVERFKGIRIRLKGEDLEMDLTDKSIAELLMGHLIPRYRRIIRGMD